MTAYDAKTRRMSTGAHADACYFMLHSESSGRALVPERVVGFCLAAALIAELLDSGRITLKEDSLAITAAALQKMDDVFLHEVLDEIGRERTRHVRDWLALLSLSAPRTVTRRMHSQHLLYHNRRPFGQLLGLNQWQVSAARAGIVTHLVASAILSGQEDATIAMLFGLARAARVNHPMFYDIRHVLQDPQQSAEVLTKLDGQHTALLTHLESAIESALLSQRL